MRETTAVNIKQGDRIDVELRGHGRWLRGVTVKHVSQQDDGRYDWLAIEFVLSTLPSWMVGKECLVLGKDRPVTIH